MRVRGVSHWDTYAAEAGLERKLYPVDREDIQEDRMIAFRGVKGSRSVLTYDVLDFAF